MPNQKRNIVGGIDEAGRGPVIGPLVICGVVFDIQTLEHLKVLGLKDSKLLSPNKREKLAVILTRYALDIRYKTIKAKTIDTNRLKGGNLNQIELNYFGQVAAHLSSPTIYVDAVDVNPLRFQTGLKAKLASHITVIAEHKADIKYPVVSAASILAKVQRDNRIKELHKQYGNFGSGYPSDPNTRTFLKTWYQTYRQFPPIVRTTWATCQKIMESKD
jgi:ribonuclease HII